MNERLIDQERLHGSLILVVDDVEVTRQGLADGLRAHGYQNVLMAADGAQALELTHAHHPDMVILDLVMPAMDGFAYLQAVRRDPAHCDMPVIVQTALEEIDKKIRAFSLGASDYICKPIELDELHARTRAHLTQKILMADLSDYKQRMTAELNAARQMQQRLMPGEPQIAVCERVYDLKIAAWFEPSSALGGDGWGMRPLSDNRLAVYMYDFSGHGVSSAMNVFRIHTLMQECLQTGGDPGHFLACLNRSLHPLLERDEFATMFYGIIDTDANCLLYACAATPPALLLSQSETSPLLLNGRGFPLGTVAGAAYDTRYIPFMQGDLLVLYSDCLVETANRAGDLFSDDTLKDALKDAQLGHAANPARTVIDLFLQRLRTHAAAPLSDDLTLAAYWRNAG